MSKKLHIRFVFVPSKKWLDFKVPEKGSIVKSQVIPTSNGISCKFKLGKAMALQNMSCIFL